MNEINIGKNITKFRRSRGITQDELASYIGVSKSSVSKWENNITYPDIVLLPQLATLFNISLDELIGYEPQLTKQDIQKIYYELAQEFAQKDPNEVLEKCEEYIKKYYSCFEFLKQMVVLYLNHYMLFENKGEILNRARELCIRIREESENPQLIKDAINLELLSLIMDNKPTEVLERYAINKQNEKALDLIQKYTDVCIKYIYDFKLRGDEFFDKIENWLKELDLGVNTPRSQQLIKQSVISSVKDNPVFADLKDANGTYCTSYNI